MCFFTYTSFSCGHTALNPSPSTTQYCTSALELGLLGGLVPMACYPVKDDNAVLMEREEKMANWEKVESWCLKCEGELGELEGVEVIGVDVGEGGSGEGEEEEEEEEFYPTWATGQFRLSLSPVPSLVKSPSPDHTTAADHPTDTSVIDDDTEGGILLPFADLVDFVPRAGDVVLRVSTWLDGMPSCEANKHKLEHGEEDEEEDGERKLVEDIDEEEVIAEMLLEGWRN